MIENWPKPSSVRRNLLRVLICGAFVSCLAQPKSIELPLVQKSRTERPIWADKSIYVDNQTVFCVAKKSNMLSLQLGLSQLEKGAAFQCMVRMRQVLANCQLFQDNLPKLEKVVQVLQRVEPGIKDIYFESRRESVIRTYHYGFFLLSIPKQKWIAEMNQLSIGEFQGSKLLLDLKVCLGQVDTEI